MDSLFGFINEYIQSEQQARIVFVVLAAAAALAFAFSVMVLINSAVSPFENRKRVLTRAGVQTAESGGDRLMESIDPITKIFVPKKEKNTLEVRKKLMYAGFRSENAVKNFYAIKMLVIIVLSSMTFYIASLVPELSTQKVITYSLFAAVAGFLIPSMVLDKLASNRIKTIYKSFPDALDLLVVCVESGLGLSAALQRVAQELDVSHPELSEELNLVNSEVRAGVHRIDALKNLAYRTGVDDIKGLVALLDQAMRFGGSVADTLRVYSEEFRDKRTQRAEELAAKIGTKMIFPLTFCLWPGFFLVAVGPAILRVLEVFGR